MKVGNKVKVTWDKQSKPGEITYQNKRFIIVKFQHYQESFLNVDIKNGYVIVDVID